MGPCKLSNLLSFMSTEQSYVGRGTNATLTDQTAQKSRQTAINPAQLPPLFLADWQSVEELLNRSIKEADPTKQFINPRIFEAQSRLLDLEDRFAERGNYAPIQAAEDLLLHWCITSAEELSAQDDPDQLHVILMLLDTLEEAYGIDNLPTRDRKGLRTEPSRLYQKYTKRLSPDFLNLFDLTDEEEKRAGVVVMPDERMSPQIKGGSSVVVVSLEPCQFMRATGVVLLATHQAPDQLLSGRIIENDKMSLLLLPDNPAYCEQRICYSALRFLSSIRYVLNQPLV